MPPCVHDGICAPSHTYMHPVTYWYTHIGIPIHLYTYHILVYIGTSYIRNPHIHTHTNAHTQHIYSLSIYTYTDTYKDAVFSSRNLKNISRGINYEFGNIVNSKRTILKSSNERSATVIIKVELSIGLIYVGKASEANVTALSRWLEKICT